MKIAATSHVLALLGAVVAISGCGESQPTDGATTPTPPAATTTVAATTTPPKATSPAVDELRVTVADGRATGDTSPTVAVGRRVRLRVVSDADDTVHVHGYDRESPVSAATPASIEFTADIPGRFEVELHHSGLRVMELTVK